jgi:hypothetical protein
MFAFVGRNSPPPPPGTSSAVEWGNPAIISERLAYGFGTPFFARGCMHVPAISIEHFRGFMERSVGPMQALVDSLAADSKKLAVLRSEFDALAGPYFIDNQVHQDYLLTRAHAR